MPANPFTAGQIMTGAGHRATSRKGFAASPPNRKTASTGEYFRARRITAAISGGCSMLTSEEPSSLSGAPPTRRAGAGADATDRDRHGCWAGGVSTIGGRGGGLGLAGGGPGAGRTSIGGGSGAACWLITGGADAAAGGRGGATT